MSWGEWLRRLWTGQAFGGSGPAPPVADQTLDPTVQSFLQVLSQPESGGQYNVMQHDPGTPPTYFDTNGMHPTRPGPGGSTTAAGRYQFVSWHMGTGSCPNRPLDDDARKPRLQCVVASLHRIFPENRALAIGRPEAWRPRAKRSPTLSGQHWANLTPQAVASIRSDPTGAGAPHVAAAGSTLVPSPAARLSSGLPAAGGAPGAAGAGGAGTSVNIGSIVVNTQATDSRTISRDIGKALSDELVTQGNRGLQ